MKHLEARGTPVDLFIFHAQPMYVLDHKLQLALRRSQKKKKKGLQSRKPPISEGLEVISKKRSSDRENHCANLINI